jgi:spore coat protein U-like protein
MKVIQCAVFMLGIAVLPASGRTQTTHALTVSAQIVRGCEVNGGRPTNNLDFGTIDFGVHPAISRERITADRLGMLGLTCTVGMEFTMTIDGGAHPDKDGMQRYLANGSARIAYQLYSDTARRQEIGVGQPISFTVGQPVPVYGALTLPGRGVPAGVYTDTVQMTLSY